MNKLFICYSGQIRSVTAAHIFGGKSCGFYEYDGRTINSHLKELVSWADQIFVMETWMVDEIKKMTGTKKIFDLNIEDLYFVDDPRLVEELTVKMMSIALAEAAKNITKRGKYNED